MSLMVQEGLRCCEVIGLQLGDIDSDDRSMRIVGKGGHHRVLPLTAETWGLLQSYLAGYPATRGTLIRSFSRPRDPITSKHVSRLVSQWILAAGVNASGHQLRHTCAGDVLRNGGHVRDVQAMLGHASISTTERYLLLIVGDLRAAMEGRTYRASGEDQ